MGLDDIKDRVLGGELITKGEALRVGAAPLKDLCEAANEIRKHFCGDIFDICTIVNAKSGRCSEDCKYCAQSSYYDTPIREYPLLGGEAVLRRAKRCEGEGINRFSIVTSGKKLSSGEIEQICMTVSAIREKSDISVCASLGLLDEAQFLKLKAAGVTRIHNNLETSRAYFPRVCSTHTYDDKITTILAAQRAGMSICSGGIVGLGESMEDRIDMALELRRLAVRSVPVNILNPIPGTPYANKRPLTGREVSRIVAVFRFLLPDAFIRLAGGRGLLEDRGRDCFLAGANAAISGDMLTTAGPGTEHDKKMLAALGYRVVSPDG